MPPSLTSKLEPRPTTKSGRLSRRQKRINSANALSLRGSTQNCAGPPTRKVVCFDERLVEPDVACSPTIALNFSAITRSAARRAKLLVNVARAQAHNHVARIQHVAHIAMDPFETWLITHAAMSMHRDFVGNRFSADSRNRRFAGRINVSHNHAIGIIESATKLVAQRFCPRIPVRLKHGQHAFATDRCRSFQCRADFGRVMSIVVNQQKTIALILDFKTAARVLKLAQ